MNKKEERKALILAMEMIARNINDEITFEDWLINGVADGDIKYGTLDINEVDDYYTDVDNFQEIAECFLRIMKKAYNNRGLYTTGIIINPKNKK